MHAELLHANATARSAEDNRQELLHRIELADATLAQLHHESYDENTACWPQTWPAQSGKAYLLRSHTELHRTLLKHTSYRTFRAHICSRMHLPRFVSLNDDSDVLPLVPRLVPQRPCAIQFPVDPSFQVMIICGLVPGNSPAASALPHGTALHITHSAQTHINNQVFADVAQPGTRKSEPAQRLAAAHVPLPAPVAPDLTDPPPPRPPPGRPATPLLASYSAHIAVSPARACPSAKLRNGEPPDPSDVITRTRAFLASAAAERGVDPERVCWWFQSGFTVDDGGAALSWSTGLVSPGCPASFSTFFMLNCVECGLIDAARAAADGSDSNCAPP